MAIPDGQDVTTVEGDSARRWTDSHWLEFKAPPQVVWVSRTTA
jgi:hypothetical protein